MFFFDTSLRALPTKDTRNQNERQRRAGLRLILQK
jgi:hypothetical protein